MGGDEVNLMCEFLLFFGVPLPLIETQGRQSLGATIAILQPMPCHAIPCHAPFHPFPKQQPYRFAAVVVAL